MKSLLLAVSLCISAMGMNAQENPHETAQSFIRKGDYSNAVLVLNKTIEKDRDNIELKKDLAFAYFLERDYTRSMEVVKPLSETAAADVQTFQILGMNYKAIEESKDAEKNVQGSPEKISREWCTL